VIVVDDGSTDDSAARARAFGDRVRVITLPHEGLGPARNAGVAVATGDHLAFLDSDDLWEPDALSVQVALAQRHPASGLIVADGVAFRDGPDGGDCSDDTIGPLFGPEAEELFADPEDAETTGWFHRQFVFGNSVACPAQTLLPRDVYEALGPVCIVPNGAQDYDYYLRIARSYPITFHRASLARWRVRDDSMSGSADESALRWAVQSLEVVDRERRVASDDAHAYAYVDAAYHEHVRRAAGAARATVARGSSPDPDDLASLYAIAGRHPYVIATRAILALPAPAACAACRGVRSSTNLIARFRPAPKRSSVTSRPRR
jgi:glycosyltransferase involved in cell wall biosynthesis